MKKNKSNQESITRKYRSSAMSRRDFLRISGVIGAGAALALYSFDIKKLLSAAATGQIHVVWLQGSSDSGCTISLLQGVNPDLIDAVTQFRLAIDFHPTIMVPSGNDATNVLQQIVTEAQPLDVLIVEGAIPTGAYCTVGEVNGIPMPIKTWVEQLGSKARYIVAVGTCAASGGISGASPNPTQCMSVKQVLPGKTVINIPGCPPHPDWILLTLATVLGGTIPTLDSQSRPRTFFEEDIHDDCPREDDYEENRFAQSPSDAGCLLHLGCRGPRSRGDCQKRKWNNNTNYCIAAGAPCIGCTEPGFPDAPFSPFYAEQPKGDD